MKKLGLVGGMGPESTIPYYHDIVYGVQKKVGKSMFPQLTIESVDVFNVLGLCDEKKYDELTEYLLKAINNLYNAGAEFGALSANTPHIVFDRLKEKSPIPLISIIEAASNEAERRGYKKIGLLGTLFTMEGEFFRKPFIEKNIEIICPNDKEKEYVNEKISKELELGIVKQETLNEFMKIVNEMKDKDNIEAIVLGCTELPLLFNNVKTPVPCLDTMQIHVDAIVDEILSEK